ncbi:HPr(Ser) kinase/phosphatase [Effusibacillus lacus]|uniref:HPr kinase/phosphorylase n=1 Tax=Effusibacillus lacus TaxID=1348429 RepID=A0A292YPX5_9BACL|nr:HPr(Ser) kinase/phosphatase [Effusibacillus lacus]TCS74190.1 Hpr(Ser) kinase/phosphatase [Effusibacillus lacus]GAX90813.1 HPr kinase/phosphorylase [Effusibacillus lacus]
MRKSIQTHKLIEEFDLVLLNPGADITREIQVSDINRPGLALAGFFTYHPAERVQLLGRTELAFFNSMQEFDQRARADALCRFEQTPCIVVSRDQDLPEVLLEAASHYGLPVLRAKLNTTKLAGSLQRFLDLKLAPETQVHGVLVDVYGIGILIMGSSGIGKSETALELIKRGHRLVADDAVEIHQMEDEVLYGESPDLLKNLLEIRGLGILNVMTLFGAGAIRTRKQLEFVIRLEMWKEGMLIDRLGLDENKIRILDTELPCITLPVMPGRNLAVLIEVAAMNQRLKRMGYHAARDLSEKLLLAIEEQENN